MTDILNIPGLRVVDVLDEGTQYTIKVEVTAPQPPAQCCLLGKVSLVRNGTKRQTFRDLPIHGKFVDVWVSRQRFRCKACGATVYGEVPGLDGKHRMTERLRERMEVASFKRTFTSVAQEVGVTEGTVRNVFHGHISERLKDYSFQTPRVLGLDEKSLLGSFRLVIGNVEQRALLDILPNRFKTNLASFLDRVDDKHKVEVICQDMYPPYRDATLKAFPKATVVVDKFHVVRMVNDAVEKFRRVLNKDITKADRVKLKNQRKLLLARYVNLTDPAREKLDGWLAKYPALDDVYWLKERFYDLYDCDTVAEAEKTYARWAASMTPEYAPFFKDILTAMGNWKTPIFAYFEHPYTNAYMEGMNRLIDDMNRNGRGYSFEVLRAKALLSYGLHKTKTVPFRRASGDSFSVGFATTADIYMPAAVTLNYGVDIDALHAAITADQP